MRPRFRLLSFLAAMLTASVLIGLNLREVRRIPSQMSNHHTIWKVPSYDAGAFYFTRGWPFVSHYRLGLNEPLRLNESMADRRREYDALKKSPDSEYALLPDGTFQIKSRLYQIHLWHLVWNIPIGLALTSATLVACEFLLRRRESRDHDVARL